MVIQEIIDKKNIIRQMVNEKKKSSAGRTQLADFWVSQVSLHPNDSLNEL
jgi:hypothetical protein